MKPRKIRLLWIVGLTVILLASAMVALSMLWPRLFPSFYVSDLYCRYEDNEYIRVTEIHNFQVNDTLAVDVLLMEATTDSAWCELLKDFGTPEKVIEFYRTNRKFIVGEDVNSITEFIIDINNPKKYTTQADPNCRLVIGSYTKKTLCLFLTEDTNQQNAISLTKISRLKNEN